MREFVVTARPEPWRVWKGGSGQHFTTPLHTDWMDLLDPLDPVACSELVFCVCETLLLTPEAEFVWVSKTQNTGSLFL